ncbi:MAG TPA: translation initiation factor IF-6 [Candidatus Thermoplasmatota archaeon]|nr:translation initiation factor IF-6 [Candidatus Thermoplasmatota archaeon]
MSAALIQVELHGSPYVGVFAAANDHLAVLPPVAPASLVHDVERALDAKAIITTVGGSSVLGAVVALNSRGAVVADIATEDELGLLRRGGLKVFVLEGKLNAAGNNVLCNDQGALLHPDVTTTQLDGVAEALGLERVETGTIAGIGTVGSAAVATNKGCLTHPRITPREKAHVEEVLGVPSNIGTVNHGTPYIGAGLVANSKGAAIGRLTTGPELNRLEDTLGYI